MATILRAYNNDGVRYDLDLFNEEDFLLNISAIESGDIGKVFGISSQQFSLPATDNNTEYFGNLDNLGAQPATSFIKTLPCQVLSDGQAIFTGNLYLDSVVTDQNQDTIYNVVVVNETIDFKYQIRDLTFNSIDWSDYNHTLNYTNITESWDQNLFNGDVVYSLVEYGKDEGNSAVYLENGGGVGTFTNGATPLLPFDFKPAIRLRTLMNKIFEATDYSYTSSFFDSADMDDIYVLATADNTRNGGGSWSSPISESFAAYNTLTQTVLANTSTQLDFNTEVFDNAGGYNPATSTFTAALQGGYFFQVVEPITIVNVLPLFQRSVNIKMYVNGAPKQQTGWFQFPPTSLVSISQTLYWAFQPVILNVGDQVTLVVEFATNNPTEVLQIGGPDSYFQMLQGPQSYLGGTVNLGDCFSEEEKLIDFLNGVIQKFNLVIVPDKNDPSILSIETFDIWRDAGQIVDWTDKVDRSVKWEIKHPLQFVPKSIYFTDEEDVDYFNKYYTDVTTNIFGDYRYFSDNDFADGERTIGSYFAPTPMKAIDGTNDFIVPQIYGVDNENNKIRVKFKPRLLYYLGKKPNLQLYNQRWFFEDELSIPQPQNYYPQFHHVNQLPATSQSLDLHFGNLNHYEYHQDEVNRNTPQDAFYTYWSEYVNELYDVESRLVTMNIDLKPGDIPNIRLNDKIFIDGHYYRINNISGANLTNEQSTKVELIKTITRKLKYPRRRISDLTGSYTDVTIGNLAPGGRIQYVDFETGVEITSSVVLAEAASRDGYPFYESSNEVSWVPLRGNLLTNNTNAGSNIIDPRAYNITVKGGGNTVGGYVANSNINGYNNDLTRGIGTVDVFGNNVSLSGSVENLFIVNQTGSVIISDTHDVIAFNPVRPVNGYDSNKVVVGNILNQGAQYETYNNIIASASAVFYLTGSEVQDRFHWHFSWTGSNGTATVYINDASDPQYDGQMQRFTTDETLTASNIVNLTPISGTIDGATEESLTVPYDGMTAEIINGQWIVVQRKK